MHRFFFFYLPPSFWHFLPPRGGKFRRGEVSFIGVELLRGGGNFFRGEGNSQKYCIIVGGDDGSREAVWGYSRKCVIVSGCVGGLRGLVFRLFFSARTGLRKDLIGMSFLL